MDTICRENPFLDIFRIAFFQRAKECRTQIAELNAVLTGDASCHLCVFIKHCILRVHASLPFSDNRRRAEDDTH